MPAAASAGRAPRPGRMPGGRPRGALLGPLLWAAGVLAAAGVLVAVDRAWQARSHVDPTDPAVRVAGAIRSISGSQSVRRATFDPSAQAVRVEATSRYYDPSKPAGENREYLATEGRMAAQLALFDNPSLQGITVRLYSGRVLLATIKARQGQTYDQMSVVYGGPLGPP